ncbi:phage late control D family protein [Paraburkholderia fungorum]|uniref:phage late control D family protein n=1 Tax=Paraburkholderia fungorum TaxID=134537 RepID=UPI00402BBD3B
METLSDAQPVPEPAVTIKWAGKDVTGDITPFLTELTYTDFMEGESDSVELVLEDADSRWVGAWYPQFGDKVEVWIGYRNAQMLPCGSFEIDEIEFSGPPDVMRVKALAAGIKRSVRTRNGRAYENTTLANIAATIARRNRLKLISKIETIAIRRVTQSGETDLVFLKRLAEEYGYSFTVRGGYLHFFKRAGLKATASTLGIMRSDVTRYRFRDKVHGVAAVATVNYHDPRTKRTRRHKVADKTARTNARGVDEMKIIVRAESDEQARTKAAAALDRQNEDQTSATLTMYGNIRLMAGINVDISKFGHYDGKYTITQSRHSFSRSAGYGTEIELKRVRDPDQGAAK